jgi:hypothetical protein
MDSRAATEVWMVPIPSLCLAHWRASEGRERARELEELGFSVRFHPVDAGRLLRILKDDPPEAIVVDLSRSPSQGRDLAVALRIHGATRFTPLIFAGGAHEKVAGVRKVLPDAVFVSWDEIGGSIREAIEHPLSNPIVPDSALAGYSGTPLPKKLGIREGMTVLVARGPDGFRESLRPLPDGARLVKRYGGDVELILWFVRSAGELEKGIEKWASRVGKGGIWIIWPKKASGFSSDLTQVTVRRIGLDSGLVDYKIASIDGTWSGLKFALRRKPRGED